ncbi:hypothetical protein C346_03595 [Cryptococcus neoformans D17-1]|nr:hypothetical protein C346_03595 [Cryptococcus neoformans var. grubii D17-1]
MGPILCQLADLPNQYRSQFGFMMLMGITPAPHEPPGVLLHRLLLPLAVELLSAGADGLWIKTPNYKQGQKVFVRIGTICCDRLAAVAITGSPHFAKKDSPCMKCTVPRSRLYSSALHSPRNGAEHSQAMLTQQREFLRQFEQTPQTARQPHVARCAGCQTQATQAAVDTLEQSIFKVSGHLSVFDLFPNFDKVLHAVIDPMHALLEGVLPFYIRRVCILGRYCDLPPAGWETEDDKGSVASLSLEDEGFEDVVDRVMERGGGQRIPVPWQDCIKEMMEKVIFPPYIDRIGKGFFTKQAKPTAAQWRTFGELLGPLIFLWLWAEEAMAGRPLPQEELATCLKLFAVVRGTFQSALSEAQVDRLRLVINEFRDLVARRHPFLPSHVTNFHVIQHIPDDILSHGPVYGWRLFALERLNGRIKHINMSGGNIFQEQVVELRALLRRRMALSRLKNTVRSEEDVTHEKELHEELVEGFKLGEIVGNNGHLKYSGVTKGVRPQPVQQQPVNHRDQLSNLLNLLGGLRLVPGPAAQGNLPMVHSHASVHQAIPANPSVQGRAQNMNNKPGIGAVRGRGAANGVPFAHRGAHNGVPAFAHGGASNG